MSLALRYSGQPILEAHAFRQTQTAITSYWFCQTGFRVAYETPAAGYPWAIPFEFPIYQGIVSAISCGLHLPLTQVGRLVSYAFLLACLLPAAGLFRRTFPSNWQPRFWSFAALFLLSPVYLFWGRAFMMETLALFLTLCFAYVMWPLMDQNPSWMAALTTSVFLSLAFLVKGTTVLPVWLLVVTSYACWTLRRRRPIASLPIAKLTVALLLPFLLGVLWTHYTDVLKMRNVVGVHLTSSGLFRWNFGTLSARLSLALWYHVIGNRILLRNLAGPIGCALIGLACFYLRGRARSAILWNLAAFLLPILILENLHFVHDYYQTANVIYLEAALAIAICGLADAFPRREKWLSVAFVLIVASELYFFWFRGYRQAETVTMNEDNNPTLALSSFLRKNTSPTQPLLIFGLDWSSEVPFYSERRALGIPNWFSTQQNEDAVRHPGHYLGQMPGAIIFCGQEYKEFQEMAEQLYPQAARHQVNSCEVLSLT